MTWLVENLVIIAGEYFDAFGPGPSGVNERRTGWVDEAVLSTVETEERNASTLPGEVTALL